MHKINGFRSPLSKKNKVQPFTSPKRLKKVIESIHEETKNDSEDDSENQSPRNSAFRRSNTIVKGILALTKDNLRKLELKNKVKLSLTHELETKL
jgi:hypothetical protein